MSLAQKAFLKVGRRPGFNLLQAAVFKGDDSILCKAHYFFANFVKDMNFETTGNKAKLYPGKTAVDILSNLKKKDQVMLKLTNFI